MSRSGYTDDGDDWVFIRWRGAVSSALRGRRGQAFLGELLAALDALPTPELCRGWQYQGQVCALGAVARRRNMSADDLPELFLDWDQEDYEYYDPTDHGRIARVFGIARAMAAEIEAINDEGGLRNETPAQRFQRVRRWVVRQIHEEANA